MARLLAAEVADFLQDSVDRTGAAAFMAAGGRTPVATYAFLRKMPINWSDISVTLTDQECVDPASLRHDERGLRESLLRDAAASAHWVPLRSSTPPSSGDEIVLLGMGVDGHVASLFPGNPSLESGLKLNGGRRFVEVPASAAGPAQPQISVALDAIAAARRVILVTTGAEKRRTLERAMEGSDVLELPVRAVLQHAASLIVAWAP